jgi:hypothetical protein
MGRLPDTYADRRITARDPYAMYGELAIVSGQTPVEFPPATFQCSTDRPLEIHRVIPRVYALDDGGVFLEPQPDQEVLAGLVRMSIVLNARDEILTRGDPRIGALTKGEAERTWEWADPEYLEKSTGFTVTISASTFPTIDGLASLLVGLDFQGYKITIHAPTNNR